MNIRRNLWLLFVCLLLNCFFPVSGHANGAETRLQNITVVSDDNYPPYIFRNSNGVIQGILVDEWKLWEKKTGIKVNLIAMDWSKAQEFLLRGNADVIDTIFFTEERANQYDFTQPYATIDVPVFFHKNLGGIVDIKSMQGFTIGVKAGDACIEVLKKQGITNLQEYNSYETIVNAAMDGKIKVFSIDKPPALYYLYKMNFENEFRYSFSLYTGEFHRAVKKGRTDILKIVEDGFASINRKEYDGIEKKWMGEPFVRPVYLRYVLFALLFAGVLFLVLIFFNITLRRKVRSKTSELQDLVNQLRLSEERFRGLADSLPQIVFETDEKGTITFVNHNALDYFGYTESEFDIKLSALQMICPEDRDRAAKNIQKILSGEILGGTEFTALRKDGSTFPVEIHSTVFSRDNKPIGLRGIIVDLSKRMQAERVLQESENKFRSFSEQSLVGIYLIQGSVFKYVNPKFADIFGYTVEQCLNDMSFHDLVHPDDITTVEGQIRKQLSGETKSVRYTFRGIKKSGEIIHVEIYGSSYLFDGKPAAIGTMLDITDRMSLQMQLVQAHKMEAVGTLAGGVAHDFNNILTTIIGNAHMALMEVGKDGPLQEKIEEIKKAGERAAALTRQLLAFSRKQIIQPKILDSNELLRDIEKMLGRLIGEDVDILIIPEPALWQVEIDPGQMEQVVMNLVINAKDAMPMGGKLTIETANMNLDENCFRKHGINEEQPGTYVMLAVSDTGIGMNKATQEHIFDPFFTTKEIGKGTGLGLSTVYGIAKQNNGFIWVYSEPGQGTTFKVYLPKVKEDVETVEKERAPVVKLDGSETVLIVEDDDSLRKLARKALQQHGYRVLVAENGEDALRISKEYEGSIDLMVTDVVMPKMSGRETAERLKPLYPQMKVIYMSGYTDNAIAHHGVLEPGLNFLEKPFSPEGLARKVREVLDK